MLIFLARLDPHQWAVFNQLKPVGITTMLHTGMMTWGDAPDLDGFTFSGLYRDAATDTHWVIQYTCKLSREKHGWQRTEFYRCWKPDAPTLSYEDRHDVQEMIDQARQVMMLVGTLDDDQAHAIYRQADIAAQGFHCLLAIGG